MTTFAPKFRRSARSLFCTPLNRLRNLVDPPVIVLLYHRVTTLTCDPEQLSVTPENFRAQLRHLKENHHLVRFEDDWSKGSRPAIAVTFDDGYADNALEALPIIEELEVPVTFFISTGRIGTDKLYWWHELEDILMGGSGLPARFTLRYASAKCSWPTGSHRERQECYHGMVHLMKGAQEAQRAGWMDQLRQWSGYSGGSFSRHRSLTVEELQLLAASRHVDIGAHTVTHSRLSSLPPGTQHEEIATSKKQLERWLGKEITVFSYPFGRRADYTRKSIAICRESGFSKAASNFPGQAHSWTDPFQVPRHLVRNWPVGEFAARLQGFWTR